MFFSNEKYPWTVGDLKKYLEHTPDDLPIALNYCNTRDNMFWYLELVGHSQNILNLFFQPQDYFKELSINKTNIFKHLLHKLIIKII